VMEIAWATREDGDTGVPEVVGAMGSRISLDPGDD
jgi:hypothetical protein